MRLARASAVYEGWVRHRRLAPRTHAFRVPLYMVYLDLDEAPAVLAGRRPWWGTRPSLSWFRRADYLGDRDRPLREAVLHRFETATGRRPSGPVRVLTNLRTFGYLQNPVSFYYCFAPDGAALEGIVVEITNTPWGERHVHVLDVRRAAPAGAGLRWSFDKEFHVSPFFPLDLRYDWTFATPGRRVAVHMESRAAGAKVFDATLSLERRDFEPATLRRVLVRHPFVTARVLAGIYLNALRLRTKGVPFHPHPGRAAAPEPA